MLRGIQIYPLSINRHQPTKAIKRRGSKKHTRDVLLQAYPDLLGSQAYPVFHHACGALYSFSRTKPDTSRPIPKPGRQNRKSTPPIHLVHTLKRPPNASKPPAASASASANPRVEVEGRRSPRTIRLLGVEGTLSRLRGSPAGAVGVAAGPRGGQGLHSDGWTWHGRLPK